MWFYMIMVEMLLYNRCVYNTPREFFENSEELTEYLNRTDMTFSEIIATMSDVFKRMQDKTDREIILSGNIDKRRRFIKHFPEIVKDGSWELKESIGPETFKSEELKENSTGGVFPDFE